MSELKEFFLDIVHATNIMLDSGMHMPSRAYLDRETYERICEAREKQLMRQIRRRLEEQRLLKIEERGNRIMFTLTENGKVEALKQHILTTKRKLPRDIICAVSFDIPEVARKARWFLRYFLKRAGFTRIHHSLWQTDRDIVRELRVLIQTMKVGKWVQVFIVKRE